METRITGESESLSNRNENDDDSEDESEVLEESPCGRWLKRREEVEQRDIPGIDATYLAMDTEEGVEVVWNEVISERKSFKERKEKMKQVFDRLIQLDHPNIVKLHKYWMDEKNARVVFITEYMSSGSLKQFLKKTKRNVIKMALTAWKRWCTQILSALCYLHSSQPPIIHGNLTCDTIFISHNGLIKMGAVAPDAIHRNVKTVREETMANMHFVAPEIGCVGEGRAGETLTSAVDIYSFGICALEMAALEITGNGEMGTQVTAEVINRTIESLDNPLQKDLIRQCLNENPELRPTAKRLLFHPVIFEVPSLRLLSTHVIVNTSCYQPEQLTEDALHWSLEPHTADTVLAEITHSDGRPGSNIKCSDAPRREVEKFFEEVRNGAYPLTAIMPAPHPPVDSRQRTTSPELAESVKQSSSPENPYDEESRRVVHLNCSLVPLAGHPQVFKLTILLRLEDKINRQLNCHICSSDDPKSLAEELVYFGFINSDDREIVASLIEDTITKSRLEQEQDQEEKVQQQQREQGLGQEEVVEPKPESRQEQPRSEKQTEVEGHEWVNRETGLSANRSDS